MINRCLFLKYGKKALALTVAASLCMHPVITYAEGEDIQDAAPEVVTEVTEQVEEPAGEIEEAESQSEPATVNEPSTEQADEPVAEVAEPAADQEESVPEQATGIEEEQAAEPAAEEAEDADPAEAPVPEMTDAPDSVEPETEEAEEQIDETTDEGGAKLMSEVAAQPVAEMAEVSEAATEIQEEQPAEPSSTLMTTEASEKEPVSDGTQVEAEDFLEPMGPSSSLMSAEAPQTLSKMVMYSVLDEYLAKPAEEFNQKLAEVCVELSNKAYAKDDVANYLKDNGFEESDISAYNYNTDFAYTLAVKDYVGMGADGNTKILVLAARGSSTFSEFMPDCGSTPTVVCEEFDYKVHKVADRFYQQIAANISSVMQEGKNYKILATGHSLGGAAANLFSAMMMKKGYNDITCYTFGAIDSIEVVTEGESVTKGYENIHNIYNDFDTFSPTQFGPESMPGSGHGDGAGQKYGKFGHMDSYAIDHRTEEQKHQETGVQVLAAINHSISRYMEDVKDGMVTCVNPAPKPAPEPDPEEEDDDDDDDGDQSSDNDDDQEDYEPSQFRLVDVSNEAEGIYEDMYNGEVATSYILDSGDAFRKNVDKLTQQLQTEVLYSGTEVEDLGYDLSMNDLVTIKDKQGKTIVMLQISNKSDKAVKLGFDYIIVNGVRISLAAWKSTMIPASKSMMLAISLSSLTDGKSDVSLPLCIYTEDGNELMTLKPVTIIATNS